jgi:hypothetical protein
MIMSTDTDSPARTFRVLQVRETHMADGSVQALPGVIGWGLTSDEADDTVTANSDGFVTWKEDDPGQIPSKYEVNGEAAGYPAEEFPATMDNAPAAADEAPDPREKKGTNSEPAITRKGEPVDLTRCKEYTASGRRCKLAANHTDNPADEGHMFVFRSPIATPKPLAELRKADAERDDDKKTGLAAFVLSAEEVPDDDDLSREYNKKEERDEDQKRVDADALKSYDAWNAAGKPEKFEDLGTPDAEKGKPVLRYVFPPEAFDTIVLMLRRATQAGGTVQGKRLEYRRKSHVSGNAMVYFRITDHKKATTTAAAPADDADAAMAEAEKMAAENDADAAAANLADAENPADAEKPETPEPAAAGGSRRRRTTR